MRAKTNIQNHSAILQHWIKRWYQGFYRKDITGVLWASLNQLKDLIIIVDLIVTHWLTNFMAEIRSKLLMDQHLKAIITMLASHILLRFRKRANEARNLSWVC